MRHSWFLFLTVSLALAVAVSVLPSKTIRICAPLEDPCASALRSAGVTVRQEGSILILEINDPEAAVTALCRAYAGIGKMLEVTANNIACRDVIKTADGTPYRRRYVQFDPSGGVSGIAEDAGDFNWIYDPKHPDAVQEGERDGYVAHPNINVEEEQKILVICERQAELVREILAQLDPELIVIPFPAVKDSSETEPLRRRLDPAALMELRCWAPIGRIGPPFKSDWIVSQSHEYQAGQASVACAINWITGGDKLLTAEKIDEAYGFQLLNALRAESASHGLTWSDDGNLSEVSWPYIEHKLNIEHLPVIVAFNGLLSPSPKGHIVVLIGIEGEQVSYADPATGTIRTVTREALEDSPSHPDGNFVFSPSAQAPPDTDAVMEAYGPEVDFDSQGF